IEKAWKRSSDSYHAMRLRVITNLYHHSIIKAKTIYHASLIAANKLQPKRLWQTVNTILHRKLSNILPSSPPTSSLAYKFASLFTDKITKFHCSLSSTSDSTSTHISP